jgi:phospholipase C
VASHISLESRAWGCFSALRARLAFVRSFAAARCRAVASFAFVFLALTLTGQAAGAAPQFGPLWSVAAPPAVSDGRLAKLKHLIFIIQENRSFDHYFGTYPGADGFPNPLPCLPSMWYPHKCFKPYENHDVRQQGGPYADNFQVADIDGGKMDGFVIERELELETEGCKPPEGRIHSARELARIRSLDDDEGVPNVPAFETCTDDVMGYHDGTDLPNYWAYAKNFVLLDHFFESVHSQSHPAHLELFSGWTAFCTLTYPLNPDNCVSASEPNQVWGPEYPTPYLWTDITYLLWQNGISWNVYLDGGQGTIHSHDGVPPIWNVLPGFETVQDDGQVGNASVNLKQFYTDAAAGTLPQVSWILPEYFDSEHPQAHIDDGQAYVTGLVNAIMQSPDWKSTAIFISHDDMGGFYDHEAPALTFDELGLGVRVPALLISPYAREGFIDHRVCSTDCYIKLIEDVFLGNERMRQAGRPDPRPDYRDEVAGYGNLGADFNFARAPRGPLLLPQRPMSLLRDGPPHAPPASSIGTLPLR